MRYWVTCIICDYFLLARFIDALIPFDRAVIVVRIHSSCRWIQKRTHYGMLNYDSSDHGITRRQVLTLSYRITDA
jgi:hypothetical protein